MDGRFSLSAAVYRFAAALALTLRNPDTRALALVIRSNTAAGLEPVLPTGSQARSEAEPRRPPFI